MLLRWWRQFDRFDWLSAYLEHRRMRRFTQLTIAMLTASLGLIAANMLFSPAGPKSTAARIITVFIALQCVGFTLMWLRVWPSRTRSLLFSALAIVYIAVICLIQDDPGAGLLATTTFTMLGGYIAFFHTPPLMTVNICTAVVVGMILCVRLVTRSGDMALGACAFGIITTLNAAIPVTLRNLVHTMGVDITRADRDSLTGLLNRRAFYRDAESLLRGTAGATGYLTVLMIDLDNFKQVNDIKGHPAGDQALIDVAKVLRIRTHPGTVIARVGGEEFLLAQLTTDSTPTDLSRSICQQIAALPVGVTASIGSASIAVDVDRVAGEAADTIDSLIAAADSVMYEAKHAGGNRVRHHPGVTC